jgi:hypothetical protein
LHAQIAACKKKKTLGSIIPKEKENEKANLHLHLPKNKNKKMCKT